MHPETRHPRPQLIVISGHSGSGKTTLATVLAVELHPPLLSKDVIKEALFDSLGRHDWAWSQQRGAAAIIVLFRQLEVFDAHRHGCIVESIFRRDLDSSRFCEYGARYGLQLIGIQCDAPAPILVERVQARVSAGLRHPGHGDHTWATEQAALLQAAPLPPLDRGGLMLTINTADPAVPTDSAIADWVRAQAAETYAEGINGP